MNINCLVKILPQMTLWANPKIFCIDEMIYKITFLNHYIFLTDKEYLLFACYMYLLWQTHSIHCNLHLKVERIKKVVFRLLWECQSGFVCKSSHIIVNILLPILFLYTLFCRLSKLATRVSIKSLSFNISFCFITAHLSHAWKMLFQCGNQLLWTLVIKSVNHS